jgi:DNA processing protein
MPQERAFWLAWSQVSGIGPVLLRRLQQQFGSLAAAWDATADEWATVEGIGAQLLKQIQIHHQKTEPEALLEEHEKKNPQFWTPADPDYPRLLLEIPDPPPLLYYRGEIDLAENQGRSPTVAIVGTREPSDYGKRWTRKLAMALAEHGFTVVSGMAEGIDTQAHAAALEAGGRTLAIVGTGVDQVYPPRNRGLYQQILQQGAVLSEYPAGTQPNRVHFPRRNRIIAGLCRATLVMEAPSKSGALITAYVANEYGRDVYVLPGSLDNPKAIGCLGLVSRGAQLILNEGHLLEMLGAIPQLDQTPQPSIPRPELAPELAAVLDIVVKLCQQLAQPSVPFDLIVEQSQLSSGAVSSALLQLELLGVVNQLPGMRYQSTG